MRPAAIGSGLVLALWALAARADMPMAPFIGWMRLGSVWAIALAIAVEAAALKWLFALAWRRAAWLSLVVNLVTAGLGVAVYPLLGMALYPLVAPAVLQLGASGFGVEAGVALVFVALADTALELGVLALVFGLALRRGRALGFLLANALSAAILFAALLHAQHIPRLPESEIARLEAAYAHEIAFMARVLDEMPAHVTLSEEVTVSPWTDEAWVGRVAVEANRLRFLGLRVEALPHHTYVVPDFGWRERHVEAARESDGRAVQRIVENRDRVIYRYRLSRPTLPREISVSAIFAAP